MLSSPDLKSYKSANANETFKLLPQRSAVDLAFHNLRFTGDNQKVILTGVSGEMRNGELTAIIGSSGAGKTTLLNILTGYRVTKMEGEVTVNGLPRNMKTFKRISAYIMQDDLLHGNLTIQEAMSSAAALKLSGKVKLSEKMKIISEILETLRLTEQRNTLTHRLSGGERKRLSIGLELISNPPIMFFDEPTSGLDSLTCLHCIRLLKLLAAGGRNIICTIHQPSARLLEMFDHLYAMSAGKCIYQGPVTQLLPHLQQHKLHCPSYYNPTDYLIEIVSDERNNKTDFLTQLMDNGKRNLSTKRSMEKQLCLPAPQTNPSYTALELSSLMSDTKVNRAREYPVSQWQQFLILSKRAFLKTRRDLTLTYLRIGTQFIVSTVMCLILGGSGNDASNVIPNFVLLQFIVVYLTVSNMIVAVLVIPSDTAILMKEHFNQWYSLKSYYLAATVVDMPFQFVTCSIYITIIYYYSEQPLEVYRFLYFLTFCQLLSFVAQSMGFAVGSAFNMKTSIVISMGANIPCLLYAGYFIPLHHIPSYLQWIAYLSYTRYAFEGITLSIYGFDRPPIKCYKTYCPFRQCKFLLEMFSLNENNYIFDIIMLLVFFVGLRFLAYLLLKWKLSRKQ